MRLFRKLGLALAATLIALLGANALVAWRWPVLVPVYRLDPGLLHDSVPGARGLRRVRLASGEERTILLRFNAVGCRGPELESPKSRPRILVIGDSFALGATASEEDSYPVRLGAALGGRHEIVNMGLESYGPDQSYLRLERDFLRLDPDLVVLVLCATNDFGDLLRNKLFHLRDGKLTRGRPVLSDAEREDFERDLERGRLPALLRAAIQWREARRPRRLPASEEAVHLVSEYLEQAHWEYENTVLARDPRVYSLRRDAYDADVAIRPGSDSARYKAALMTAVLEHTRDQLSARGVPLAVVVGPCAVDIDPSMAIRVDPEAFPTWTPRALGDAMTASARAAGVETLDLTESFVSNDPSTLFVGGEDIHWNDRGMALAAQVTAPWLEGLGLVP